MAKFRKLRKFYFIRDRLFTNNSAVFWLSAKRFKWVSWIWPRMVCAKFQPNRSTCSNLFTFQGKRSLFSKALCGSYPHLSFYRKFYKIWNAAFLTILWFYFIKFLVSPHLGSIYCWQIFAETCIMMYFWVLSNFCFISFFVSALVSEL